MGLGDAVRKAIVDRAGLLVSTWSQTGQLNDPNPSQWWLRARHDSGRSLSDMAKLLMVLVRGYFEGWWGFHAAHGQRSHVVLALALGPSDRSTLLTYIVRGSYVFAFNYCCITYFQTMDNSDFDIRKQYL